MNYSFLTTEGCRLDITARTPKQAYKIAENKIKKYDQKEFGILSGIYFKYDKNGTYALDGIYYQMKGTK